MTETKSNFDETDAGRGVPHEKPLRPAASSDSKWRNVAAMLRRPRWLMMAVFARLEIVQRLAGRKRKPGALPHQVLGSTPSAMVLTELAPEEIVRRIGRDGIADGLRLSEETVADMLSFAARAPCYGNYTPDRRLDYDQFGCPIPAGAVVGSYLDDVADWEVMRRLWQDPIILAIAAEYLGRRPVPIEVRLWWSFRSDHTSPALRAIYAQDHFHYDLDNWRAIKFFFYLTAVGAENGPHLYIRTSHRNRSIRDQLWPVRGRSNGYIAARFDPGNLTVIQGPAGTGFTEDPYGFHTGTAVRGASRLMLEIVYGVSATDVPDYNLQKIRRMAGNPQLP
jgi:hypothetical protein